MKPRYKYGLIFGLAGLVLNVCVAAAMGICGPVVSLLASGLAAFLAAREEKAPTKGAGASLGVVTGLIAGALVLLGQILGGVGILAFIQKSGMQVITGMVPTTGSDPSTQALYYGSGLITVLCIGLVGVSLAAGVGALFGYLGTPQKPAQPPEVPPVIE